MSITTQDQLVAAYPGQTEPYFKSALAGTFAVGQLVSLWTAAGNPGAGAAQGTAAGAVPTSATAGALVFTNPSAGNSYIAKGYAASSVVGTLILYDRLAHGSALSGTVATAQTVGSPALTRPDANGTATELLLEVYTALGATPQSVTASYTNQSGTAAQTASGSVPASAPAGLMIPMTLAAGDTGVRAVASVTLAGSTGTAGNFGYTIIRRLAMIPCTLAQVAQILDVFMLGMPQVYNSACVAAAFLIGSGTAAPGISGQFSIVQG